MLQVFGVQEGRLTDLSPDPQAPIQTQVPPGAVWIDLNSPKRLEETLVEKSLSIDIPTREELAEIEASSRLYQEDGATFMTATLIKRGLDDERPEAAPVTFILSGSQLVTVRYSEPRAFPIFIRRMQRPGQCAGDGEGIFLSLLEAIVDRAADHLESVGRIIDETSLQVFERSRGRRQRTKPFQDLLIKVGEEGDFTSKMRESLMSIGRLVAFYAAVVDQRNEVKEDRVRLKTLQRDIQSLADHSTFLSGKISFLLDAVLGMISIEQNGIIKIFSVAAVVFLPPTLVASIYGMNFQFMPELSMWFGYPMALGLMVLSAVVPYFYFRAKGWL
jgi:magnesium transporter